MTHSDADAFARDWIEAWNAHDLDRIMHHYAENVEFVSPLVTVLLGDPSGTVHGREALRAYVERGLAAYPNLAFRSAHALAGVGSVTITYESVGGRLSAEVMELDDAGMVRRVLAHYGP